MKWYKKFKVGQEVKVVRKINVWQFDNHRTGFLMGRGASWATEMDMTIGKIFKIVNIDTDVGYRLETRKVNSIGYNYWYPVEALQALAGKQLEFGFMNE